jgi:hypothetical protein
MDWENSCFELIEHCIEVNQRRIPNKNNDTNHLPLEEYASFTQALNIVVHSAIYVMNWNYFQKECISHFK